MEREAIEALLRAQGWCDFRWISGAMVQVRQWVRMKCRFGCESYGHKGACPPVLPEIAECREFFAEYEHILVLRIATRLAQPEDRHAWSRATNLKLLDLERAVFLAGYPKAFLLFMDDCQVCAKCAGSREDCTSPEKARPCVEGMGVDVFATVRALGFPIRVLTDYADEMNRYAFLMVE